MSDVYANEGGCWFCWQKDDLLVFEREFDTYVHLDCIRENLKSSSEGCRLEAEIMNYLLVEDENLEMALQGKLERVDQLHKLAVPGPYSVERVDHVEAITYEISIDGNLHVIFDERMCLDRGISAKQQAQFYAESRMLLPALAHEIRYKNLVIEKLRKELEAAKRRK